MIWECGKTRFNHTLKTKYHRDDLTYFSSGFCLLATVFLGVFLLAFPQDVYATATASEINLSMTTDVLRMTMTPAYGGYFQESNSTTISVNTNNFTGYTLKAMAQSNSTSLENQDGDEIESIGLAVSGTDFANGNAYINKWGYKPSQYIFSNTVVQNTNFLPVPDQTGDTLDITNAANSTDNTYTISVGAKVDFALPADTYTYTYIIAAVGNPAVYNITYNANTVETVTDMPSPNPQVISIDGGTPAAQSYGALSNATPTMTSDDMSFGGWCDVATTVDSDTGNYLCSGTIYQAGDDYPIDQTSSATNITLYAIWLNDPFPVKWSQTGKCVFNNGTISGSECQDYTSYNYIDTGIALYSNDNYLKDYEVHFTIESYVPTAQPDSQSTIFNDKLSSSVTENPYGGKSPGIIVRRNGSKYIEIKSTYGAPTDHSEIRYVDKTPPATAYNGTDIRIFRIDGIIYTSVDNGPLVFLQDYTSFNQQFGLTAWFGGYPDNVDCSEGCTAAKRYFTGELSDMYIKLGDMPSDGIFDITFNTNGGTPSTTTYKILNGNSISEFPEVSNSGWLFDGWWTASSGGQQISTSTVPTASTTYYAHWYKSVTDAQITNTSMAMSVNDTETINITNAADIEPYTLVSSDTSVVTVNSAGVITAVGNGAATITMIGTKTGDTRTISVTVGSLIYVDFYSQGGTPSSYREPVANGSSFSSLPEPVWANHIFKGWYTGLDGTGTQLTTSTVFNANTPTQYYANWEEAIYVCKIATVQHREQCLRSSNGCRKANWGANAWIDYGYLITDSSSVTAGAAYDCDVDYDGTYDPDTERFYYFGTENGNAKLIYSKNMSNNASVPYADAIALLPNYELDANNSSVPVWDNPYLVTHTSGDYTGKAARFMTHTEILNGLYSGGNNHITPTDSESTYLFEQSNFTATNRTDGIWLEQQTDGQGNITYVNRIQTMSLVLTHGAVGSTSANASRPTIDVPTQYIESYTAPVTSYNITFNPHNGDNNITETVTAGTALGNKYPSTDPTYADHFFEGWYTAVSGGTLVTDQTVPDGDWTYHAQWKGSVALAQVASNTVPVAEGNTATITVTNASELEAFTFSSSDTSVATVDPSTGVVTALAEGTTTISITGAESHLTNAIVTVNVIDASSTFRVTFDPQNGGSTSFADVLVGNAIGAANMPNTPTYANHVFQRWYDTSNNNTVTSATQVFSAMTVYAEWKLDVTQAVISNADLTLAAGDQLTILVSNSAQLEPYTFSSADTSIATVDASTGVITGVAAGTVNIIMTGTQSNLTKSIEVEVTPAPVIKRTVTFNANGGTTPSPAASFQVDDGDAVGSLPTTSRANYRFFGWYKDDGTFYDEVYEDEIIDADVTFYARWIEDTSSFPIEFAEINECQFSGNAVISGTYCTQDKTKKYIDSAVALFSTANYQKDFEIGFTIVELPQTQLVNQGTLVNSKYEDKNLNYPGFVYRSYSTGPNFELTARFSNGEPTTFTTAGSNLHRVRIVRENQILKYSINDGAFTTWFDVSGNTHRFDTTVWFGASANSNNSPQRFLTGKLTDMYVKLGSTQADYLINFDPGNGSFTNASDSSRTVTVNDPLGSLPIPNPPSNNHTFVGWFDESTSPATQVSSSTVPTSNKTYVAHYSYTSSNTPVTFDVSNDATRDYNTLISGWVQSPVNITTFNKATPINNSTWGDTSELSESDFWDGMEDNFEDNHCMASPLSDIKAGLNWATGSVDCSKPDGYDTNIRAELTVRLNDAQGAIVNYAKADNGVIYNMIPGQTYYWEQTSDSTIYGYVTATSNGSSTGTRWVDTGTIRNVRDLGGLPVSYTDANSQTVTGTLAYGRLFRGEKLGSAAATELTNLGITTEYNVGDDYSNDTHLTDFHLNQVIHYNFNYNNGDENNSNSNYMKAWNAVTNIMRDITNTNTTKNIYIHCRVGADRTGTVAYLLEGLLGVPDEERYEEYELTYLSGQYDRTRYYKEKSSSNNQKFVFMMDFVKTTQDIYDWYMQNPNADVNLIQAFRSAMTVSSNQQQQNSPQQVSPQNSPQSLNRGNSSSVDYIEDSDTGTNNKTKSYDASSGYNEPLGVTEVNDDMSASIAAEVAAMAIAAAVAGGAAYALIKLEDDEE